MRSPGIPTVFRIMLGKGASDSAWRSAALSWSELTALRTSATIKSAQDYAVFAHGHGSRSNANTQERCCLNLDYDEPNVPIEEAIRRVRRLGLACWAYETWSNTPKKPKYRLILPLTCPALMDAETLRQVTLAANAALGNLGPLRSESWTSSQPMFLPQRGARCFVEDGAPFEHTSGDEPQPLPERQIEQDHPILAAIRRAGLYLRPAKEKGAHYFRCPWDANHGAHNDTQTIFYPPNTGGFPRWACDCKDTAPDTSSAKHLTKESLKRWLVDAAHMTKTAAKRADERYARKGGTDRIGVDADLVMIRADSIDAEEIDWLWPRYVPRGMLTLCVGEGGMGKGIVTMDLVARTTTGTPWPNDEWLADLVDDKPAAREPMSVIWFYAEDALKQTLLPRAIAANADRKRLHFVEAVRNSDDDERQAAFSLEENLPALRRALEENRDVALVIFDPITAFLFGSARTLDMNNTTHLRSVLTPLKALAEEFGVAIWCITHFTKDEGRSVVHRVLGSGAWVHIVRKVFGVGALGMSERALVELKQNIDGGATSLVYRVESTRVNGRINTARAAWLREDPMVTTATVWGRSAHGPRATLALDVQARVRAYLGSSPSGVSRQALDAWAQTQTPRLSKSALDAALHEIAVWEGTSHIWRLKA